jgi:hypothetical protein
MQGKPGICIVAKGNNFASIAKTFPIPSIWPSLLGFRKKEGEGFGADAVDKSIQIQVI